MASQISIEPQGGNPDVSRESSVKLLRAARTGDAEQVRVLLGAGADVSVTGDLGGTPLHWAAEQGSTECCAALLEAGADPNALDNYGRPPLHYAAATRMAEVCRMLLVSNALVNLRNTEGFTALHIATGAMDVETCRILLEAEADATIGDALGNTAIYRAIGFRSVALCRLLEDACPGISTARSPGAYTPLQFAAMSNALECVQFFVLECGADLNQVTVSGQTLMALAQRDQTREFLQSLGRALEVEGAICDALGDGAGADAAAPRRRSQLTL